MKANPTAAITSALALLLATVGVALAPSALASAYRYWTYWQGSPTGWTFATAGPATSIPIDGSVEGWRFAVTTQAGGAADAPSTKPDFAAICGATAPEDGKKRVALVVDPGGASIAPAGLTPPAANVTCVVADTDATGYQVLRSAVTVRTENGLICGIADYPTGECAPVIDDSALASGSPSASAVDAAGAAASSMPAPTSGPGGASSGTPWATVAVAVLLLISAAVGATRYRRSRNADDNG